MENPAVVRNAEDKIPPAKRARVKQPPHRAQDDDPRGFPGCLVMCQQGRELRAMRDACDILLELTRVHHPDVFMGTGGVVDEAAPVANVAHAETNGAPRVTRSVADEIAAELAELSGGRSASGDNGRMLQRPLCFSYRQLGRALGLVWIRDSRVNVVGLATALLDDVAATKQVRSRSLLRLIPLQLITSGYPDDVAAAIETVVPPSFVGKPHVTWSAAMAIRMNDKFSLRQLLPIVSTAVGGGHAVDLTDPEVTIVVEVFAGLAGVSVVPGRAFQRTARFNLQVAAETDEDRAARLNLARAATARSVVAAAAAAAAAAASAATTAEPTATTTASTASCELEATEAAPLAKTSTLGATAPMTQEPETSAPTAASTQCASLGASQSQTELREFHTG